MLCWICIFFVMESQAVTGRPQMTLHSVKKKTNTIQDIAGRVLGTGTITIDNGGMVAFEAAIGEEMIQSYYVELSGFDPNAIITIKVSGAGPFAISTGGSAYGTTIELTIGPFGGVMYEQIDVRYKPTDAGPHSATISHTADGVTPQDLTVDGNVSSLPVEWHSFNAKVAKGFILLDWITASEKNNSHFDVEISKNPAAGFEKAGRVYSKSGNSKTASHYRFEYYLKEVSGMIYFRLKQVDTDQHFSYSRLVVTEVNRAGGSPVSVVPNPLNPSSLLKIALTKPGKLHVVLLNLNCKEVVRKTYDLEKGNHAITFLQNENIPAGVYFLTAEFDGRKHRLKLIKE